MNVPSLYWYWLMKHRVNLEDTRYTRTVNLTPSKIFISCITQTFIHWYIFVCPTSLRYTFPHYVTACPEGKEKNKIDHHIPLCIKIQLQSWEVQAFIKFDIKQLTPLINMSHEETRSNDKTSKIHQMVLLQNHSHDFQHE